MMNPSMKEHILILAEIFMPICMYETCMFALKPEYLARHLKETHKWDQEEAVKVSKEVTKEIYEKKGTPEQKKQAQMYLGDYSENAWNGSCKLPCLPHLPVVQGLRCPHCQYCATIVDTMRKHVQNKHAELLLGAQSSDTLFEKVHVQSVFGGSKKRWFEVGLAVKDAVNPSCPIRFLEEFQGSLSVEKVDEDVSHMNSFLSTTRFDQALSGYEISMETAWILVHDSEQNDAETNRILGSAVTLYFSRAFLCFQKHQSFSSHSVQGTRLRLQLESNTLERYEGVVKQLLLFSHKVMQFKKALVPSSVAHSIAEIRASHSGSEDLRIRSFHKFAVACFFDIIEPRNGDIGFVGIFLACKNIVGGPSKNHLRYGDAGECTPALAALKYCVRLIAVIEVSGYGDTRSGVESWKFIEARTAEQFVDTGATYVAYLSHLAHSIHSSEAGKCRFRICRTHVRCAIIDGIELSLSGLGDFIRKVQKDAVSLMSNELLRGMDVDESFFKDAAGLQDALQTRSKGFWFGSHPSNLKVVAKWQSMLWNRNGSLFWSRDDNELKLETCAKFMEACESFQRKLLVLVQLTSGAPSRATEIAVTRVVNDAMGGRNLFLCDGQIVISTFYCKTRSMNDGASKPIARFPDAVTSGLLLKYLMIVRPLEFCLFKALALKTGGDSDVDEHRVYLFARRGRSVAGAHLCGWFKEMMGEAGFGGMTISQYRQFQAGMVKNFFRNEGGADMQGLHAQAGHSEATAHRVYGVSEADFRHLTGTELESYRAYSQSWQEALGMTHGSPRIYQDCASENFAGSSEQSFAKSAGSESTHTLDVILDRVTRMEKSIERLLQMKRSCSNCDENDSEEIDGLSRDYKRSRKTAGDFGGPKIPAKGDTELTQALGAFLKMGQSKEYGFKSPEQKLAVETVRGRETDAIVILPTGGGKSLSFMLPCFVETELVSILIVPLVSLQQDMLARCERVGIDAVSWSGRERVGVRIVIASIEHVQTETYARFLGELYRQKRLARIVVDEAHLVLTWSSFRSSMHSVATCIRPVGVVVPVVLLTATAPPRIVTLVTDMCGISKFKTIRSATFRPNISYRVIRLKKPAGRSSLNLTVAATILEVMDKFRPRSSENRIIVYLLRRADVEGLKDILCCDPDTDAYQYHAGMSEADRKEAHESWQTKELEGEKFKVMVATSAFGTGIDNPSVRAVLHVEGATNLLQFVQESGRAGRDGEYAESIVISLEKSIGVPGSACRSNRIEAVRHEFGPTDRAHSSPPEFGEFQLYVSMQKGCRRGMLDSFCDGLSNLPSCVGRVANGKRPVMCDICEDGMSNDKTFGLESERLPVDNGTLSGGSGFRQGLPDDRWHSEKAGGGGNNWGSGSVTDSAGVAQGRRKKSELEAAELCTVARKLSGACAVCTVRHGVEVRHASRRDGICGNLHEEKQALPCQSNRCDRCGTQGHSWQVCALNPKPERNSGCARCGISKHCGIVVHGAGEFGKQSCSLKNMLSISLLCWEDTRLRASLKEKNAELRSLRDIKEYASWLRGARVDVREGLARSGLALIAKWLQETFLEAASIALRRHGDAGLTPDLNESSITGSGNRL
jgi:superfamily II DNA/RNA helicase